MLFNVLLIMKTLLLLIYLVCGLPASSAPKHIGVITESKDDWKRPAEITVTYEYDGKGVLTLLLENIEMNAAARGVTGSIVVEDGQILIKPREIYDERGPVDSLSAYSIKYTIPNIPAGHYSLVHDDSEAEGNDRISRVEFDLSGKDKTTIKLTFDAPDLDHEADPFADPPEDKKQNKPALDNP